MTQVKNKDGLREATPEEEAKIKATHPLVIALKTATTLQEEVDAIKKYLGA